MKERLLPLALISMLCVSACEMGTNQTIGNLPVAASIYPLAYLAEQIGGDTVTVTQITPGGVEPHDYEPSPQDLIAVQKSMIFLMNGGGIDAWADKVHDDLIAKRTVVLTMIDQLPASGDERDPHLWLDPLTMEKEVAIISNAFMNADPENKGDYGRNAKALIGKLKALDARYRKGLKTCAVRTAVVSHDAFRLLGKAYGFETLAISGLSPDEEPSAKRIAEIADFARKNEIKYIFFETLVSPKLAQTVADEIGAKPLVLNPIEGLTPEEASKGADYVSIMDENLTNLRTALQCK